MFKTRSCLVALLALLAVAAVNVAGLLGIAVARGSYRTTLLLNLAVMGLAVLLGGLAARLLGIDARNRGYYLQARPRA